MKHSSPVPTEEDFQYVHPAPAKLLHEGLPAEKVYHLVMKEKLWTSWSGNSQGVTYSGTGWSSRTARPRRR